MHENRFVKLLLAIHLCLIPRCVISNTLTRSYFEGTSESDLPAWLQSSIRQISLSWETQMGFPDKQSYV